MEPKKIKSVSFHCFSIVCHEVNGPDAMIFLFLMLNFKPTFSLASFTFIKRLFSSFLSAIRVVSSVYVSLLIFLPAILIPACDSSSLAFLVMYSAYKLLSVLAPLLHAVHKEQTMFKFALSPVPTPPRPNSDLALSIWHENSHWTHVL